jgi:hypothetical protein
MEAVERLDEGWVAREFKTVDLGDERLNRWLNVIARDQGAQLRAPLNQRTGTGWRPKRPIASLRMSG